MRQFLTLLCLCTSLSGAIRAADESGDRVEPLSADVKKKCLDVLNAAARGDDFWPAMHAVEALTLAGESQSLVPQLKARLESESDHQRRCGLAREIVRTGDRTVLAGMFRILGDEASNGRIHAAESLYKIAEVSDGRLLRKALSADNMKLKLMAAAALARAGNRDTLQLIRASLSDPDLENRKIAAWILSLLGSKDDIEPIRALLKDETDPLAQAYYVNALACQGDKEGLAALKKNLSSPDPVVRTYSADFASYARPVDCHSRLIELLDDPNVDVRVRSAQALIAMSLPASAVGLPVRRAVQDIRVDVYPATEKNPRYSEGSIIALRDGSILYATTEFIGGGADHATARVIARTSNDGGVSWSEPRVLQDNVGQQNVMSVTLRRLPPGNDNSPLGMFFLVKNSQTDLNAYLRVSQDDGQTFGESIRVTPGSGYHVMNNDRITILSTGRIVAPISWTDDVFKKGGGHFDCVCFLSDDGGNSWRASSGRVDQPKRGAMEPEVVELADGKLLMIIRTQLGKIATSISEDGGDHWSEPSYLTVEAPESPATIRTIPSTGDLLLIWNKTYQPGTGHGGKRTPLTAAISKDSGKTWQHIRQLETDQDSSYAYTSVLFHKDRVLLSYYVGESKTGRISSRFRSLPVRWFYENP